MTTQINYFCSQCGNEVDTPEGEVAFCPEHPSAVIDSVPVEVSIFKLELIKTEDGNLLLKGSCPGETLEFYAVDGEGGPATSISFTPWNQEVTYFPEVESAEYDSEDTDSFWNALTTVLQSARRKGIELPDYNALDQ